MKKINNSIVESYCSFEIGKLLKEKGFDIESCDYYSKEGEFLYDRDYPNWQVTKPEGYCDAPTHALAVEWIRINFGIWITITSISQESWQCHITKKGDSLGKLYFEDFNSPQEATESALKYILEELI